MACPAALASQAAPRPAEGVYGRKTLVLGPEQPPAFPCGLTCRAPLAQQAPTILVMQNGVASM